MKYQYTYRTTASELWQLSMYYIYGSMVGLCNHPLYRGGHRPDGIADWQTAPIMAASRFLWPPCVFLPCCSPWPSAAGPARQAARIHGRHDAWERTQSGIHIQRRRDQRADLPWRSSQTQSAKKPTMLILFSRTHAHGYVLSNRVLGGERDEFYAYAASRAGRGRS